MTDEDSPSNYSGDCTDNGARDPPRLANLREIDTVYQPAEDSILLAETAIEVLDGDYGNGGNGGNGWNDGDVGDVGDEQKDGDDLVLDVGTGSGYVAARIRAELGVSVVGSDVNFDACRLARDRDLPVVCGDLVSPFRSDSVTSVVCNPPYLPTPPEQEWNDPMESALSGGPDGLAMIQPLLDSVGRVLKADGRVLLLISSLTGTDTVESVAREAGFQSKICAEQSIPGEKLLVLELQRSC